MKVAVFVMLICVLAALIYLIAKRKSMPPTQPEQEREKYRHLKDYPNP